MIADYSVKCCVKVIEEVNHLNRLTVGRDCGEANNIAEIETDTVKMLGFNCSAQLQSLCH